MTITVELLNSKSMYIIYTFIFHIDFLLLHTISNQDGRTPAELAQSRGYRDIAKLIIHEGMYFII